jgi:peptidoglycan hydrolase-like protein with peptidoglycan-binding domain
MAAHLKTFRTALPLLALVSVCDSPVVAEEPVRSTQEELRRRNVYFGDIDGRRSTEYEEAIKQYQRRKGFQATGKADPDTLRSLGLMKRDPNAPKPKELEWPEETVLKSDSVLHVVQEARELATDVGISPTALAPKAVAAEPPAAATKAARNRGAAPTAPAPSAPRAVGGIAPIASGIPQTITPPDVVKLVSHFLHAVGKGDLKDELSLYADRVDYYGKQNVDRRLIERQLRRYYAQWPSRSYKLAGVTNYQTSPRRGEITVTFQVDFTLKNDQNRVKGRTQNRIVLNAATSSPRIVSIQERRLDR